MNKTSLKNFGGGTGITQLFGTSFTGDVTMFSCKGFTDGLPISNSNGFYFGIESTRLPFLVLDSYIFTPPDKNSSYNLYFRGTSGDGVYAIYKT